MLFFYLNLLYIVFIVLGKLIILFSRNLFFYWLALELVGYSFMLVMVDKKKRCLRQVKNMNFLCSYFILQALSSVFFCMGAFLKFDCGVLYFSLSIKVGIFPIFWWLPHYCNDLDYISLFIYFTLGKFGVIYLYSYCLFRGVFICGLMLRVVIGVLGMGARLNCFKVFIRWGSLVDRVLLIIIVKFSPSFYIVSFIFYSLFYFFLFLYYKKVSESSAVYNTGRVIVFMLMVGVPLFFKFLYKFMFLGCFLNFLSSGHTVVTSGFLLVPYFVFVLVLQSCFVVYYLLSKRFFFFSDYLFNIVLRVILGVVVPLFTILVL